MEQEKHDDTCVGEAGGSFTFLLPHLWRVGVGSYFGTVCALAAGEAGKLDAGVVWKRYAIAVLEGKRYLLVFVECLE
jgi:hypothetical protein